MSNEHAFVIPCLGRPFAPGMLYDCRSDQLITGMTLWKSAKLEAKIKSKSQPSSNGEVIVEDTLTAKTAKLDVDASLKLSLMSGLLSVDGSAKYLNDRKESSKQARVSLRYSTTSHFDTLTMDHLSANEVDCPEAFENNVATHVVTGVVYGADAVFVFDQEANSIDDAKTVNGSLKIAATAIKETGGNVDVKFSETLKETSDKISCKFYGDFQLEKNPSTLADAVSIYKDLPSIIKTTVPKKAYLYPLSKMEPRAAKLVREISINLIIRTENILEKLLEVKMMTNDLLKSCHPMFDKLLKQADDFKQNIDEFELNFRKQLNQILPKIRSGAVEERDLVKIVENVKETPLDPHILKKWVTEKQSEVDDLNNTIFQLKEALSSDNVTVATSRSDVSKILSNFKNKMVLSLAIDVGTKPDLFLNLLTDYCRVEQPSKNAGELIRRVIPDANMARIARSFMNFVEHNFANKEVKFLVYAEEPKVENLYAHIQLHNIEEVTVKEFMPPSAPVKAVVTFERIDEKSGQVTAIVNWQKPKEGHENVTSYRIAYVIDTEDRDWAKSGKLEVKCSDTMATIPGLRADAVYLFRICSVCEAGESEFSSVIGPALDVDGAKLETLQIEHTAANICLNEFSNNDTDHSDMAPIVVGKAVEEGLLLAHAVLANISVTNRTNQLMELVRVKTFDGCLVEPPTNIGPNEKLLFGGRKASWSLYGFKCEVEWKCGETSILVWWNVQYKTIVTPTVRNFLRLNVGEASQGCEGDEVTKIETGNLKVTGSISNQNGASILIEVLPR